MLSLALTLCTNYDFTVSLPSLIVLVGPTGVGKTALSLRIAQHFGCEIVSADSRQLYHQLQIGTAAPTPEQLQQAPHHLVGTLGLEEYYSAARYEEEALHCITALHREHPVVLLTGGSMMYADALCKGIDDLPTIPSHIREALQERYRQEGLQPLCRELEQLDYVYYHQVDLNNHKRVIHALEICHTTGKPYSLLRTNTVKQRDFRIIKVGLNRERPELFDRINSRVEEMIAQGLVEEARSVLPYRHLNALNTVGYKEVFAYFDGEYTLPQAIEKIQRNSRVYAKKQLTWFKRDEEITWFHPDNEEAVIKHIEQQLQNNVDNFC